MYKFEEVSTADLQNNYAGIRALVYDVHDSFRIYHVKRIEDSSATVLICPIDEFWVIAVGTHISVRPLHRSRRAQLTHRAPTLSG